MNVNWLTCRILSLSTALAVALPAAALQAGDPTIALKLEKGRTVFAQVIKPSDPSKPTLVLLPGVNRSLLANEPEAVSLAKAGFGLVTFNFSPQPLSVALLDKDEKPYFRTHEMQLKDLADETDQVIAQVKSQFGLTNLIPVTLSYSGAISPFLKGYPLIIETVPMTSAGAENPQLEMYRQSLKAAEFWNPVFGPSITRASLDSSYRTVWVPQVAGMIKLFSLPAERSEDMVQGYTVLSRVVEGFSWDEADLQPKVTRRVFILAGNESGPLFKHQVQTFLQMASQTMTPLIYIVLNTGHIIPSEQPEAYAEILDQVSSGKTGIDAGVIVVDPAKKEYRKIKGSEAWDYLKSLIK